MARRRRRKQKNSISISGIISAIALMFLLTLCNQCSHKISDVDRTATQMVRDTERAKWSKDHTETANVHDTVVAATHERRMIESTMTSIAMRTEWPTVWHQATVEKRETQAVQQATMEVLMTEAANE